MKTKQIVVLAGLVLAACGGGGQAGGFELAKGALCLKPHTGGVGFTLVGLEAQPLHRLIVLLGARDMGIIAGRRRTG